MSLSPILSLNCLDLELCSVERSLNIISSLIFQPSKISWYMDLDQAGWKGSTVPRCRLWVSGQWAPVCWKHPLSASAPSQAAHWSLESPIRVILSLSLGTFPSHQVSVPHSIMMSSWPLSLIFWEPRVTGARLIVRCVSCDNWHGSMGNNNQDADQLSWDSPLPPYLTRHTPMAWEVEWVVHGPVLDVWLN